MHDKSLTTDPDAIKAFAIEFNNEVWGLLEKEERTKDETENMIHAVHASFHLWSKVGNEVNAQRGYWLMARVYAEAGDGIQSRFFAKRCLQLTETHETMMADFDRAYALEAMARSGAVGGDRDAADWYKKAKAAGEAIKDDEDKKYFLGDLTGGNWGKLDPEGP